MKRTKKDIICLVLASLFGTAALFCSVGAMGQGGSTSVSTAAFFFGGAFLLLAGQNTVGAVVGESKIRRITRIVDAAILTIIGVLVFFAPYVEVLYPICFGIYFALVIGNRVAYLVEHHKVRNLVSNSLLILLFGLLFLVLAIPDDEYLWLQVFLFATVLSIHGLWALMVLAFKRVRLSVISRILRQTYALEILYGLAILMVAFSLVLPHYEGGTGSNSIRNFGDGLWYCFAVVTTIGFGDKYAVSLPGRIMTVILGIYGIIVVALITSIIVNFYNETASKTKKDENEESEPEEDENEEDKD